MAVGAYDVFLYRVTDQEFVRRFDGKGGSAKSVAFSPDRSLLAAGTAGDAAIPIWDVATGALLTKLTGHSEEVDYLTFSPDGK
jgi:WD40 repeat protein